MSSGCVSPADQYLWMFAAFVAGTYAGFLLAMLSRGRRR